MARVPGRHLSPTCSPGRRRLPRLLRLGIGAVTVVAIGLVAGSARPAMAQVDGVSERGTTTWVVEPDAGRATVTVRLDVTNTTPVVDGRRTWWERWGIALPLTPDVITVTTGTTTLDTELSTLDGGTPAVRWTLPQPLHHGDTQSFVVEAVFDSAPPRSDLTAGPRINPGFVAVPVWAWGRDHATLTVRAPARLDARLGGEAAHEHDDGTDLWEASVDDRYAQMLVGATTRDDHVAEVVTVGDTEVTVLAWPNDPEWGEQVADFAATALPELAAWTSTDWGGDELVIRETATPVVEGWGGWNNVGTDTISVGEVFDRALWTHELAHNWFGPDEFSQTWLAEGLSETVTALLAERLGVDDPPVPDPPEQPLADWQQIVAAGQQARLADPAAWADTTTDLYAGAHHVVDSVADELGEQQFRELVRMTLAEESIWDGPGELNVRVAADWREFLVLAEHFGSTRARGLLLAHVAPDAGPLLARRDRVVASHADLAEHDWATPVGIRQALQDWRLDDAEQAIDEAVARRGRLDAAAARADRLGTGWPDLRRAWEVGAPSVLDGRLDDLDGVLDDVAALAATAQRQGLATPPHGIDLATDDLDDVRPRLADLRAAVDVVAATGDRLTTARDDDMVRIGLVGSSPDLVLEDAQAALAAGDVDASLAATADLTVLLDDAPERARTRLAIAVAGLVVVVLATILLVRRRRRRREAGARTT